VTAVLRLREVVHLAVEVVGAQSAEHLVQNVGVDFDAAEVGLGVVGRLRLVGREARAAQQLAHVVDVGVHVGLLVAVADVGDEEALADRALEPQVRAEQHEAVEEEGLGQQLLAVLVEEDRVHVLLDEDACEGATKRVQMI